ncbi:MAG: pyruvate flavodoxin/ferredoxin oxidoreductase, partial [Desulfobacula sp.]|nr:pyruvate flavodoxin/ferredoxin oxidoreductase [Desulfobacula sp.]
RGADSDIQFLRWGSTSGVPVIVLVPTNALDCYELAFYAFNYAEEFRCPVFIASNKEIGMNKESFDMDSITLPSVVERSLYSGNNYLPFKARDDKAPPFLPIGGKTIVRQTSSTHGPDGYITIDSETIAENQERLRNKIHLACNRITLFDEDIKENSDTLVISYGVTSRAVTDAARILENKGKPVSTLTLKTLWPVPEDLIREKAKTFKKVIVIEMNLGQYINEIQRVLKNKTVKFYGQMDGSLISPAKIMEVIENE